MIAIFSNKPLSAKRLLTVNPVYIGLAIAFSGCVASTPVSTPSPQASPTPSLMISPLASPTPSSLSTPKLPTLDDNSTFVTSGTLRDRTIMFINLEASLPLERTAITWNGQEIVVVNNATRSLEFYHAIKGELISTLDFPEDLPSSASITGLTWDGKSYWMADANGRRILAFAPEASRLEKSFNVEGVPEDLSWDGEALWMAQYSPAELKRWSPDGVLLDRKSISITWPTGLAWGSNHLWFSDPLTGDIRSLDLVTGEETVMLSHSLTQGSFGGLAWGGGYLWVLDDTLGRLYQLDVVELGLIKRP